MINFIRKSSLCALYSKFNRIMKLTCLFLMIGISFCMANKSYSQSTLLTIKAKNMAVKDVFKEIEKNSEFMIFFYEGVLDPNKKVNADFENQTVDKILDKLFEGTNNTYTVDDKQIYISRKNTMMPGRQQSGPEKEIIGKVLDDMDSPLPGVNVLVSGSSRGVITDLDGTFTIRVKPSDKLEVSFLGLETQIVAVGNNTNLVIKLKPKSNELDEITVVAFGKQKKESVVGAISTVSLSDLRVPVGQISNSLAGQMAGIVAVQRSGEPGAGSDFWIRGISTFGPNTKPLVLVDGIERSLDLVDTEDIETFSILKDATATALYGVRGANGVILVTTRRGKEGKPNVSARVEYGILAPTKMPKMANAEQFMNVYNEVYADDNHGNIYYTPETIQKYLSGEDPDLYPNVNWLEEMYKDITTNQRINLNISGGGKMVRYYVGGSIYRENGIFNANSNEEYNPSMYYTKYNFRSNIDIDLTSSTVVNINLSTQYDNKNQPHADDNDGTSKIWSSSFTLIPIAFPQMYSDGTLAAAKSVVNPYNLLNKTGYQQIFHNNAQALIGITQDIGKLWSPLEGLSANIKFSWDAVHSSTIKRTKSPNTYFATGRDSEGNLEYTTVSEGSDYLSLSNVNSGSRTTYLEASATYSRVFNDIHRVGGLFLFYQREKLDEFPGSYENALPYRNQGIAARVTYGFKDTYFFESNIGYNGSENFAPGHRFGLFPSAAIGYLISNEKFFKPILPVVSMLKFKASYGLAGNDQISETKRFAFNATMQNHGSFNWGESGGTSYTGLSVGYPGNNNVGWEEAKKLNIGAEIEFFNSLKIQADYFNERRNGIFVERASVPSIVGVMVNPYLNLGQMKNQGVEFSVEYHKRIGEVDLSGRANFTFSRNIKLYDDAPAPKYDYMNPIGKPLRNNNRFVLVSAGYFKDEEDIANSPVQQYGEVRPGDRKFKDINGDGIVNDYDRVAMGYTDLPEINYGFGLSAVWKSFDISVFFQGVGNTTGVMDGNPINGFESDLFLTSNLYEDLALNHWSLANPDPDAKYPRLSSSRNENNKQLCTGKLYNASFLRLKNAEIGYTLPKSILKKMHMKNCRFYLQGVNLLTFAPFKLWDPEITNSQGATYPNMRTVSLGLNVNF